MRRSFVLVVIGGLILLLSGCRRSVPPKPVVAPKASPAMGLKPSVRGGGGGGRAEPALGRNASHDPKHTPWQNRAQHAPEPAVNLDYLRLYAPASTEDADRKAADKKQQPE
jgi:hypothetical protein